MTFIQLPVILILTLLVLVLQNLAGRILPYLIILDHMSFSLFAGVDRECWLTSINTEHLLTALCSRLLH